MFKVISMHFFTWNSAQLIGLCKKCLLTFAYSNVNGSSITKTFLSPLFKVHREEEVSLPNRIPPINLEKSLVWSHPFSRTVIFYPKTDSCPSDKVLNSIFIRINGQTHLLSILFQKRKTFQPRRKTSYS